MFALPVVTAASHLRWLLDNGYPESVSVKLVGDRHRLSRESREIIRRGVDSRERASRRRRLLISAEEAGGRCLGIDGHNVVLTVANYIAGVPVFEADDGLIRDIGALHGRLHDESVMHRSMDILARSLVKIGPGRLRVVFDEPLSHSRDHAAWLRNRLEELTGIGVSVATAPSGDTVLKAMPPEVVVTSDSGIIEALGRPVFDAARFALEKEFDAVFDSLKGAVNGNTDRGGVPAKDVRGQ